MDKLVVKAKTQTSAVGNKPLPWALPIRLAGYARVHALSKQSMVKGFTLIELMVVLLVLALSSSLVVMSTRDTAEHNLNREADRLVNVLEAARAQARSRSTELLWQSDSLGYSVRTLIASEPPLQIHLWYMPGTHSEPTSWVISAEPVQSAVRLTLLNDRTSAKQVSVATDGAASFKVTP